MISRLAIPALLPLALSVSPFHSVQGNQAAGSARTGGNQNSSVPFDFYVKAQQSTPGTAQSANSNITGTSIAGAFQGNGAGLTGLNAAQIASGTLADARLTANVALLAAVQTFTGVKTFSAAPAFTAGGTPFTVSSTTKVNNLNADRLDGLDSSAFLQAIPNPLDVINGVAGFYAIRGETTAANGTGTIGVSSSSSTYGVGVGGASNNGVGVLGISYGGAFSGVEAYSSGGNGVTGYGVVNGVEGHSSNGAASGVYGENTGGAYGVAGRGFTGVYGESNDPGGNGLWGTGLYGVVSYGNAYVFNDLTVLGSKFGFVVDMIKNGDSVALQPGDVVEIVGYEPAIVGDIPVTIVRRASSARGAAVLGPIDCAVTLEVNRIPERAASAGDAPPVANGNGAAPQPKTFVAPTRAAGAVLPGGYGNVVTLGSFRGIHVDSSFGAIRAGDLLVASPTLGYAMSDADPRVGTVIGKALADWNGGLGEIPVMVSSR